MEQKLFIKQDINFLDSPNWIVDSKNKITNLIIKKDKGEYVIKTTADSLPNRTDKTIFYYLLLELLNDKKSLTNELTTTRYRIAMNVFEIAKKPGKNHYIRIWEALKRWNELNIEFKGLFYEKGNFTERLFHLVDSVTLDKKTQELFVRFNPDYIKQLRETNFCKYIDFKEYKKLRKPISARLYEIFIKMFAKNNKWNIGILKLAEKITITENFPSHIVQKIIPSIKEINDKTELKIKFDYNKDTGICTFTKFDNTELISISRKKVSEVETFSIPEKYLNLLPVKQRRQEVYKVIDFYIKKGLKDDTLSSNITYTAEKAKTNFLKFLILSLHNDYAKNDREEKAKKIEVENETIKKAKEQEKIYLENERIKKEKMREENENIIALIKQLPEHLYNEIEEYAVKMAKRFPKFKSCTTLSDEQWKDNFRLTCYKNLKDSGKI